MKTREDLEIKLISITDEKIARRVNNKIFKGLGSKQLIQVGMDLVGLHNIKENKYEELDKGYNPHFIKLDHYGKTLAIDSPRLNKSQGLRGRGRYRWCLNPDTKEVIGLYMHKSGNEYVRVC
jgi:hypothetical protein